MSSSDRITRSMVESAFQRLADATGNRVADFSWKITDKRREGAWTLDYNGVYGGYVIEAYVKDSPPQDGRKQAYTAVTHPLGSERRNAREFFDACNFACRAIGERKPRRSR